MRLHRCSARVFDCNPKPRHSFGAAAVLSCALVIVSLAGCGKQDVKAASGPPPAPVIVAIAEQRDVPVQLTAIGNVEPYQTVQIRSQVNGQIEKVNFKEGQDVVKGQLLFSLDKRPFQADLEKALSQQRHDEAQAANSKAHAVRYDALEKAGVVAPQLAEQQRAQAQSDASAVDADRAAVDAARVQLQYTGIKAPIDARTGSLQMNLGNLVKANDTPFLVQLNQIVPIYVTFSVPESKLSDVRRLTANHLKVAACPKGQTANPAEGFLTFIDNGVDPQTGTVKLKATFLNNDRRLWPGEFVDVVVDLSIQKNAVVVPTKAIQTGQQGEYVYVVTQQSTVESRPVSTTGAYQNLTLVSKGISPGDRVVVEGQLRLAPNVKVVVQNNSSAGSPAPNAAAPARNGL
jgi:membrane fusion protein, multidrug efflux system